MHTDHLILAWADKQSADGASRALADELSAQTGQPRAGRTPVIDEWLEQQARGLAGHPARWRSGQAAAFCQVLEVTRPDPPSALWISDPALPVWLDVQGALGQWRVLGLWRDAVAPWLGDVAHRNVVARLLRQFRAMGAVSQHRQTLAALAEASWGVELWDALAYVARQASRLEDLAWAQAHVHHVVDRSEASDIRPPRVWLVAAVVANRCVDLPLIRRAVRQLLGTPQAGAEVDQVVAGALATLAAFDDSDETLALLEQATAVWPGKPGLQLERAKLLRQRGADDDTIESLLADADPGAAGFRAAMSWLANALFHEGNAEAAQRAFERLERAGPLNALDQLRLSHLRIRDAGGPSDAASEDAPEAFDESALQPLRGVFQLLANLVSRRPTHGQPPTAEELAASSEVAVRTARALLADTRPVSLESVLALAQRLFTLADEAFANHAKWLDAFPLELDVRYGSIDGRRSRELRRALHAHVVLLFEWVLTWPAPVSPAPQGSGLRSWVVLARLATDAALLRDDNRQAMALVTRARAAAGPGLGGSVLPLLQERCHLAKGDTAQAGQVRAAMESTPAAHGHRLLSWQDWLKSEGLNATSLFEDTPPPGEFDLVAASGDIQRWHHDVPRGGLSCTKVSGARIRLSHGLIGPAGHLLLPHQWHRMMGDYPYADPAVLNRAAQGAVLRAPGVSRTIAEPVLALANMDALQHRNYYHWTLFLLARACWLHDQGHLQGRRLLVPQEMPDWMFSGLADAGIPAEALLTYGRDECLELDDAWVAAPIEFASPTLLDHLRLRLWRAAGLDPAVPPRQERLLYVSRRGENRRPLVEEDALCALAAERGFEVVDPGAMPLLDQVRLFARARAIVSPPGAALTNLNWCQPGVRVLVLFKEEAAPPFFVDLALLRGLHYRWLMGRNLPAYRMSHVVNAPFSVDLGLAARHLDWAAGRT